VHICVTFASRTVHVWCDVGEYCRESLCHDRPAERLYHDRTRAWHDVLQLCQRLGKTLLPTTPTGFPAAGGCETSFSRNPASSAAKLQAMETKASAWWRARFCHSSQLTGGEREGKPSGSRKIRRSREPPERHSTAFGASSELPNHQRSLTEKYKRTSNGSFCAGTQGTVGGAAGAGAPNRGSGRGPEAPVP
jgi:hypothetical protein